MAHTPGPWQLRTVDHSLGTIETADEKFVIANTCQLRGNDYQSNHAERRANARLIASAPDLLEALQEAVSVLSKNCLSETFGDEWCEKAFSAIAKATGGQ